MAKQVKHNIAYLASLFQALARAIAYIFFIIICIGGIMLVIGQKVLIQELGQGLELYFIISFGLFVGLSAIGTILCFLIKCDNCHRFALVIKNNDDLDKSYKAEMFNNSKWYERDFNIKELMSNEIRCCHCNHKI